MYSGIDSVSSVMFVERSLRHKETHANKNVHVPKMQHNTIKIFQLIYTIHSFSTPYCDNIVFIKNITIKILR